MIIFYNSYNYLNYAVNVIYSKEFLSKYDFSWSKDEEKSNTISFLFPNLIRIIEGNVFYSEFCTKILEYPTTNQLSINLLTNSRNIKNLESYELGNFLMLLVYEPMVNYVKSQKETLQYIFTKYDKQQLNNMFYELDGRISSLVII